ncbi:MAG TPA: PadR family transcriptional regulator [Fimbriimonadaceae bacterium]|nr:PadR family transcriptional regulator [Fimbriimonadaceae bacterium]
MAFRGDIKALILGTLQGEPLHGYEIVRRIRETGGAGRLSEGQIYPYLHDLEQEGHLTAEWQTDTGAAPRRVYQLTPAGRAELSRHRLAWEQFVAGVGSLLSGNAKTAEGGNV